MRTHGEFSDQSVVASGASQDPATTMQVHDNRKGLGGISWLDDPDADVTHLDGYRGPCLLNVEFPGGRPLHTVDHHASLGGGQLVERRVVGEPPDQCFGGCSKI